MINCTVKVVELVPEVLLLEPVQLLALFHVVD